MATTEQKFTIPALQLAFHTPDEARAAEEAMRGAISLLATHADVYVRVAPELRNHPAEMYRQSSQHIAYAEFGATSPRGGKPVITKVLSSEVVIERSPRLPTDVHIMLDLETLGRKAGCPVLSIGAVVMSPRGIVDQFYVNLDPAAQVTAGLVIDRDTQEWWTKQSADARAALEVDRREPLMALRLFSSWVYSHAARGKVRMWGNGSDFDNTVLAAVYEACAETLPWKFYNNRCHRTLKNLFRDVPKPDFVGTRHNAVDDAKMQALHAIAILNAKDAWTTV